MDKSFARPALARIAPICAALSMSLICAAPVFAEHGGPDDRDHAADAAARLVHAGQAFSLPPNPNVAFELDVPANVVLTDVELTLHSQTLAATVFVSERDNSQTYAYQSVGTPGAVFGSSEGHYGLHLHSGISSSIGLRVGLICNNIGGNSCAGALMWSGYQP